MSKIIEVAKIISVASNSTCPNQQTNSIGKDAATYLQVLLPLCNLMQMEFIKFLKKKLVLGCVMH